MRLLPTLAALAAGFAVAVPAAADKGGGHAGDTDPGNSGDHKAVICHHAGPTKAITITVDENAVAKHIAEHGDSKGPCPGDTTTTAETETETVTVPACVGGPPVIIRIHDTSQTITQPGCGEPVVIEVDHVDANPQPPATAPGQIVLGDRETGKARPGHARLIGRNGCVSRAFTVRVRGFKVKSVVFYLDGKRHSARIDPAKLKVGVHRVTAKVTFKGGKHAKLRLSFQKCPKKLILPRFAG